MISQLRENLTRLNNSSVSNENYLGQEERVALTVILALLAVLGFLGNGIVVYIITSTNKYVDVPANIFVLSQAFADLAAVLSIPVYILHMYIWNWGVMYVILTFVWISSLGSLFLLTFNRLLSVADSLKYPRRMTPCRAKILVVIIWIAALVISLLHMIGLLIHSDGNFFNYGRYYIIALITGVIFVKRIHVPRIAETGTQNQNGEQTNGWATEKLQRRPEVCENVGAGWWDVSSQLFTSNVVCFRVWSREGERSLSAPYGVRGTFKLAKSCSGSHYLLLSQL